MSTPDWQAWPPPRAVVFDLDGTLLDSERAITEAAAAAFLDLGLVVSADEIANHLGAPLLELLGAFVPHADAALLANFEARYVAHHDRHVDRFPPPLPGVRAALSALYDRGCLLAIATTKPTARAAAQLDGAQLLQLFHHVQGTDPPLRAKPAPDVVLRACAALNVAPHEAWMVGDTERDVLAGQAAGCARTVAVAYAPPRAAIAQMFGADAVTTDLSAFFRALPAHTAG